MTRNEYIQRAEAARIFSLDKRWRRLANGLPDLSPCPFCPLEATLRMELNKKGIEPDVCWDLCPFKSCSSQDLESLYGRYTSADPDSPQELKAVQAIVDFLEDLNVVTWADELLAMNFLEEDKEDELR